MVTKELKLVVTGTPGVGKTTVSKDLAKELDCILINEKKFAYDNKIGEWNSESNELEVETKDLKKALETEFKKQKRIICEGHILCEFSLNADFAILIRTDPELLESRLEARGYKAEKIQDNVFCEGIDYCKKHLNRNYKKEKIIEVFSQKTIKETKDLIISELKKKDVIN